MMHSLLKENMKISHFLEVINMFILGIDSENRMKLEKAKEINNIFLYNDILFRALIQDGKQSWWHTDIWTYYERQR